MLVRLCCIYGHAGTPARIAEAVSPHFISAIFLTFERQPKLTRASLPAKRHIPVPGSDTCSIAGSCRHDSPAPTRAFIVAVGAPEKRIFGLRREIPGYRAPQFNGPGRPAGAGNDSVAGDRRGGGISIADGTRGPCGLAARLDDADVSKEMAAAITVPLHVMAGPGMPSVNEPGSLGVAHVSAGSGLARARLHHRAALGARAARGRRVPVPPVRHRVPAAQRPLRRIPLIPVHRPGRRRFGARQAHGGRQDRGGAGHGVRSAAGRERRVTEDRVQDSRRGTAGLSVQEMRRSSAWREGEPASVL